MEEALVRRNQQFNIYIPVELKRRLAHAAKSEVRQPATFGRLLFEWAFAQYERAGSLPRLMQMIAVDEQEAARRQSNIGRAVSVREKKTTRSKS